MRRMIAFFLAAVMFFGNADWSVLQVAATESQKVESEMLECTTIVSEAETSAIAMSMYNLDDGNISLSASNEVKWIDRIDLTDAECIRTFYERLVEASDNDGINDYLIEDQYFSGAVGSNFIENNGNIYLIIDTVEGNVATQAELSEVMNQVYQNYYFYIVAAGNAFDRDHPEVFWLTGNVAPGCLASRSGTEADGYKYKLYITYLLKGNVDGEEFDVRETYYQSQESIKNAITTVNTKVDTLINNASTFNNEQKLRYFNEQLTKTNEYNRSSDLNSIDNDCRECISALEGRIGTNGPVCEAYARAFKVLCDEVNIPCVLVDGYAKNSAYSSGEAHMWNYVQLNNSWYGADVTWNDPLGGASGAVSGREDDNWLLVGSDTMINSMKFIESHPVSNTVSSGGVSFTNGPQLSADEYVDVMTTEISAVNSVISKTYDGQPIAVSNEKGVDITWNSEGVLTIDGYYADVDGTDPLENVPTDAGTYYVKVTVAESESYPEATAMIPIVISKAVRTITISENYKKTYTYDGNIVTEPIEEEYTVTPAGSVGFSWYEGDFAESSLDGAAALEGAPTDAGTYTLVATVAENKNYTVAEQKVAITIHQALGSIVNKTENGYPVNGSYTYENLPPVPSKDNFEVVGDGEVSFTWYKESVSEENKLSGMPISGGKHILFVELGEGKNYTGADLGLEIFIAEKGSIENKDYDTEYTYTGEAITQPTSSNFTILGDGIVSFLWYEGDYTNESLEDQIPLGGVPTDAGKYTLLASVGAGSQYTASETKVCVTISHISAPENIKKESEIEKNGRFGADVEVSAEGYLVSDSLTGTFETVYIISGEGNPVEKELYFKQIETGYITDKVTVNVVIDKTAPKLNNLTAPTESDGTLQDISANISFTSDEIGTYCYIVREKDEAVPNVEEFITKADGEWSVNEGVLFGEIVTDVENVIFIEQLKQRTDYVAYIITIDELGNASEVQSQEFKTLKSKEYTIYYELNGGEFETEVVNSFTTHESVDLSQVIPVRHGYEFAGWYDEENIPVTKIPVGEITDKNLYAKWNVSAEFELRINAYNMQINEEQNPVFEIPYNTLTEDWTMLQANAVIESDPEGLIIDEAFYKHDDANSEYSLKLALYRIDENGTETSIGEIYNSYDFTIEEAGNYRLKGFYRYPGETSARELNSVDFTVKYAKREYPLADSIEIINIDSTQTFTADYIDEVVKTKLLETVNLSGKAGEEAVSDGTLVIKNAKKKLVTAKTKVASGNYTVTYQIGEHEKYLPSATATLKIVNYTSAEVDYKVLQKETTEGVDYVIVDADSKGRTAGAAVAYIPEGTENISVYTDHVLMIPQFNNPDAALDAEKIVNIEQFRTLLGDTYTVEVSAKESSSKKLLNLDVQEDGNIYVTANGKGTGKSTIVITTTVKADDKTLATITKNISNFIVAKGTTGAVKDISLRFKEKDATTSEALENGATRLLAKDTVDRYYDLTETIVTGYDEAFDGTLTWKTSNKSIAAVTVAKDGTVTLKVPKNAQGVAEITATAKDAGKKSVGFKVVVADKEVRLDTTSITMNSLKDDTGIIYLYPNTLSAKLNGNTITEIEVLDRVKSGKSYEYKPSIVLTKDGYDEETGQLSLKFTGKQDKAKTHTVYLRVTQSIAGTDEKLISKEMKITVKDKWTWPATSVKAIKAYESAYSEGYAEVLIITDETVIGADAVPAITMADNQKFKIAGVPNKENAQNGKITWRIKLERNADSVLPKKKNSTTTQKVTFNVAYKDYLENAPMTVSTKITVSNKTPDMKLYGKDSYAPSFYTDADLRYVDVVLTIPDVIENQIAGHSFTLSEDKKFVECKDSEDNILLKIALKDSSKFDIVNAYSTGKFGDVPAPKGSTNVDEAVVLTVKVLADKTAALQFNVSGKQFDENIYASKALKLTKRTVSSEAISLKDTNNNTVKTLTFSKNIAGTAMSGKESIVLNVIKPQRIGELAGQTGKINVSVIVESADKNGKAMLDNKALLVVTKDENVRITTTEKAFQYKSAKLKMKMLIEGENGTAYTKSSTITLNFKAAQTPTIKLTAKGTLYKGFYERLGGTSDAFYEPSFVRITAKLGKMPVGYRITDIRFADPADFDKYYLVTMPVIGGGLESAFDIAQRESQIALGKDTIGIIYDVRTIGGETISVKTSVSIKIAETAGFKSSVSSLNLYNSVEGEFYGKNVRFYDTKGKAIKVVDILNKGDLQKAGISYCIDNLGDGSESVNFYVDDTTPRGIEKTYTVKVKVALVTGYENFDNPLTGLSKTINVKINLKK